MQMPMKVLAAAAFLIATAVWLAGGAGCGRADDLARQPGPLRAVVTIAPLDGLVRPLLPAGAAMYVVIPPGRSEHGYEYTPSDAQALAHADLVVIVGLGLEPRVERFLELRPSPTRQEVSFARAVGLERHIDSNHDEQADEHIHDHGYGDDDPHIWLDPVLCAKVIPAVRQAIERSLEQQGELTEQERSRLDAEEAKLVAKINEMHEWAEEQLAPHQGKYIVTHHAAWGRMADRYGLNVAAVIRPIETSEPTPGAIAGAVEAIRRYDVPAIFIEPQFSSAAAERIANTAGVRVAQLDPLGDGDWFAMMRANIESLAEAMGE